MKIVRVGSPVSRRALVRGALVLGAAGVANGVAGCTGRSDTADGTPPVEDPSSDPPVAPPAARVLLAYFSRPGENYYYGDRIELETGNTQVLAGMIADRIACDLHRIEPSDPYSPDYEETVERNRMEQRGGARPAIANPIDSIEQYDVIVLASPVWSSTAPMIMRTFVEGLDFRGKIVLPVTTHAVSGLSGVPAVYQELCIGAQIGDGLAVQGEEVSAASPAVDEWVGGVGLL